MRCRSRGLTAVCATVALAVGASSALADTAPKMTKFDAARQEFHFVNFFSQPIKIHLPRPVNKTVTINFSYGLCGGMAAAALDTFNAHSTTPSDITAPSPPSRFWTYLFDRELASLTGHNAQPLINFIVWSAIGQTTHNGITGLNVRSHREFLHKVRPSIDQGNPIPLGLVKVKVSISTNSVKNAVKLLFENHQVLAVGYFIKGGEVVLAIYDPNYPAVTSPRGNDDGDGITYLFTRQRIETYDIAGAHKVDSASAFRGYFAIPYAYRKPFWAHGRTAPGPSRIPKAT